MMAERNKSAQNRRPPLQTSSQKTQAGRMGRPRNSHALRTCCCKAAAVVGAVEKTVAAVNDVYGTNLPVPGCFFSRLTSEGAFREAKVFFSGLLDALNGAGSHPWLSLVIGLPMRTRLSLASSLTSGKKLLPDPCPSMLLGVEDAHKKLMASKCANPLEDEEFVDHVVALVDKLFRPGWDRGYLRAAENATLPMSAGVGLPRSKGGVMSCGMLREEYGRAALGLDEDYPFTSEVCYQAVVTEGKVRGITINHKEHQVLKPLHNVLYDHLSRFDWLLRGDAKKEKFSDFRSCGGEVFVSGDYEAATDGLSTELSEFLLDLILSNCRYVPVSVRRWAQRSLRSSIRYTDGTVVEQARGQLMGNLLSFPLLCLYNYVVFKYFVKRRVPLRINGDDIVSRITSEEYDSWRGGIERFGMKLSAGKTFVHPHYFAINSTYFWAGPNKLSMMEVMRLGMLRRPEALGGLGASHGKFVEPFRRKTLRVRVSTLFLRSHGRELRRTGRSLTQPAPAGLGVRCCVRSLGMAGLLEREAWYLQNFTPREKMPAAPCEHNLQGLPEGWKRTRRRMTSVERRAWGVYLAAEMVARKWSTQVEVVKRVWDDYFERVRAYGGEGYWRRFVAERRSGRALKSFRLLKSQGFRSKFDPMKLRLSFVHHSCSKGGRDSEDGAVWVKEERQGINFLLAGCR